jgi:hypothetical protein
MRDFDFILCVIRLDGMGIYLCVCCLLSDLF